MESEDQQQARMSTGGASGAQPRDGAGGSPGAGHAPLAPGTRVGEYRVGRLLRDAPGRQVYLATRAGDDPTGEEGRYLLSELPADASRRTAADAVIGAGLQHPRLLAPRERVGADDAEYLAIEGLPAAEAQPIVGDAGAYLAPTDALKAGAGLADALSYLHRNGFVHLRIAPDVIVVQGDRAHLAGLEAATALGDPTADPQARIQQDVNDLARTLRVLARVGEAAQPHETGAQRTLRDVAARGAAGAYTTPEELAADCGAALQTAPHPIPPAPQEAAAGRLSIRFAFATTVGKVRSENQDATAAVLLDVGDDATGGDLPLGVFLVADGMGGEAHGELASRIAARVVSTEMLRALFVPYAEHPVRTATEPEAARDQLSASGLAQALGQAVGVANRRIRDMAYHFRQDTGTTLTALVLSGPRAMLAHLGDSRAYLLREGTMVQLTEDHTLLARLQAMDHPILNDPTFFVPRNFLYRSLGQEQAPPDLTELTLAPGDRLMLCSDGLWDELDDATIQRELAAAADPEGCARRLVELANEAGGHDNSTSLVLFLAAAEAIEPARAAPEPAGEGDQAAE